ncbi:hypothetical protein MCAG_01206 [Micromonospora sp. ATCC 39149]|uniref:Uncharacterized protein n=1 Tax=Micromonospora carbonacea TaxID=47853 RepID=A0A7D5Y562_9ACTN|nr:hypothetical protein [Micromonospora sp. ATCC 39149]EEP70879.1 hypothetical protein MCAG_01206 [Micromonospora sp. ATCC 39149]QLJ97218.1 hypothetical protein HZU44_20540 [Micromonospora carbonacea]
MIVASLLLILVAVVLLVVGLAGGSSVLLAASIAASLLAAIALVVGARQAAASRAAAARVDPDATEERRPPAGRARRVGANFPAGPDIPVQRASAPIDADDTGWRQPPGSPVAGANPDGAAAGKAAVPADEPPALRVSPADAALVAELDAEVQVVDGRPRYHLADCAHLYGREPEPLPVAEAVRLGFTPCARCAPDDALLADARPR